MIRHAVAALAVATLLLAQACASSPPRRTRPRVVISNHIEVGMTQDQVTQRLGQPDNYSGNGIFETWRYQKKSRRHRGPGMTIVRFESGRVASFEINVPVQQPTLRERPAPRPRGGHHGPQQPAARPGSSRGHDPGRDPGRASGPGQGNRGSSPGHSGAAPGHGNTPPGHGGTPPGHSGGSPGRSGAAPGHGNTPPGHGGTPPGQVQGDQGRGNQAAPAAGCVKNRDCGPGRQCRARADGRKVCVGKGKVGADCLRSNDCKRGLSCQRASNGNRFCR